jgi:hypothetical protein
MPHDHAVSQTGAKSAGSAARGKASSSQSAKVRAVLRLQNAAGNRAVAGILTDPATSMSVQRTALDPVSVQREDFLEILNAERGDQQLNLHELARAVIRLTRNAPSEQSVEPKKASAPEKAANETTATKAKAKEGEKAAPVAAGTTAQPTTMAELRLREKLAKGEKLTPEEQTLKDKKDEEEALGKKRVEVEALEKEKALRERRRKLREGLTPEERSAKDLEEREKQVDFEEREKKLRWGPTSEERRAQKRDADLAALEKRNELSERQRKLRLRPTAMEKRNEAKEAELNRLEERQKKQKEMAELKRKLSGRLTPEEQRDRDLEDQLEDLKEQQKQKEAMRKHMRAVNKPLNPKGRNLGQLLGGRKL